MKLVIWINSCYAIEIAKPFDCRYRRWKLGDDIDLIVRCEHDGVMIGANGEVSFINIKTLNEWDSRVRKNKWLSMLAEVMIKIKRDSCIYSDYMVILIIWEEHYIFILYRQYLCWLIFSLWLLTNVNVLHFLFIFILSNHHWLNICLPYYCLSLVMPTRFIKRCLLSIKYWIN